jgi:hypothetical protein
MQFLLTIYRLNPAPAAVVLQNIMKVRPLNQHISHTPHKWGIAAPPFMGYF